MFCRNVTEKNSMGSISLKFELNLFISLKITLKFNKNVSVIWQKWAIIILQHKTINCWWTDFSFTFSFYEFFLSLWIIEIIIHFAHPTTFFWNIFDHIMCIFHFIYFNNWSFFYKSKIQHSLLKINNIHKIYIKKEFEGCRKIPNIKYYWN